MTVKMQRVVFRVVCLFIPSVRSVGAPLSVGVPETSMLLVGMFSSTNSVTNPRLSSARFAMVLLSWSFAKASVRGISLHCAHGETSVTSIFVPPTGKCRGCDVSDAKTLFSKGVRTILWKSIPVSDFEEFELEVAGSGRCAPISSLS